MSDAETVPVRDISRDQLFAGLRALRPHFERAGVTHMALFGSRARGDNRPDSDVDLIVEVASNQKFSLLDLIGVGHIVEDNFGLRGDVYMRRSLAPFLAEEERRDGVCLF
jgi:hypothetical protein